MWPNNPNQFNWFDLDWLGWPGTYTLHCSIHIVKSDGEIYVEEEFYERKGNHIIMRIWFWSKTVEHRFDAWLSLISFIFISCRLNSFIWSSNIYEVQALPIVNEDYLLEHLSIHLAHGIFQRKRVERVRMRNGEFWQKDWEGERQKT